MDVDIEQVKTMITDTAKHDRAELIKCHKILDKYKIPINEYGSLKGKCTLSVSERLEMALEYFKEKDNENSKS